MHHKHFYFLLTLLSLSLSSRAVDVYKDIVPILYANCTSCHHNGGISTDFTGYSKVTPLGATIKAYLNSGTMPPWPADPSYKHYVHERVVDAADKAQLIAWIDNGMLAGDTTLAAAPPVYGATQLYGTPDLILSLPKFTSTAVSNDHYYCINVPVSLTQDRYIRAFEFVPGNAAIIHHAVITIDTTGTAVDDMSGNCFNFQGQVGIGDYAPGMGPTVLPGVSPTKFGFRLKAGSKMSFQIHVPEGTNGQQDSSTLRIYFYPTTEIGIRDMYFQTVLQNWSFYVPANTVVTATQKYPTGAAGLPIAFSLYGAFPHSHKTCTAITNFAYKTTDTIPLIRIPKWDFHWQGQYIFKNMVKVDQGYHLFASHVFDNTTANPETPDPNQPVIPGSNTYNEMLFDSYLFALYQTGDELVDIEAVLASDPLFYPTATHDITQTLQGLHVFPNPATEEVHFDYQLSTAQYVTLSIFDLQGRELQQVFHGIEGIGTHEHRWDLHNANGARLPQGNYVYQLQVGMQKQSGKLSIQ